MTDVQSQQIAFYQNALQGNLGSAYTSNLQNFWKNNGSAAAILFTGSNFSTSSPALVLKPGASYSDLSSVQGNLSGAPGGTIGNGTQSLIVFPGYTLTIYNNTGYQMISGNPQVLNGPVEIANLRGSPVNFNNNIRSLRVTGTGKLPLTNIAGILFSDQSYSAGDTGSALNYIVLNKGDNISELGNTQVQNETRSLVVFPGNSIQLYTGPNYTGTLRTYTGPNQIALIPDIGFGGSNTTGIHSVKAVDTSNGVTFSTAGAKLFTGILKQQATSPSYQKGYYCGQTNLPVQAATVAGSWSTSGGDWDLTGTGCVQMDASICPAIGGPALTAYWTSQSNNTTGDVTCVYDAANIYSSGANVSQAQTTNWINSSNSVSGVNSVNSQLDSVILPNFCSQQVTTGCPVNPNTGSVMPQCSRFVASGSDNDICRAWQSNATSGVNGATTGSVDAAMAAYCNANPNAQDCNCINANLDPVFQKLVGLSGPGQAPQPINASTFGPVSCWWLPCKQPSVYLVTNANIQAAKSCNIDVCQINSVQNAVQSGVISGNDIQNKLNCNFSNTQVTQGAGGTSGGTASSAGGGVTPVTTPPAKKTSIWLWVGIGLGILVLIIIIGIIIFAMSRKKKVPAGIPAVPQTAAVK